MGSLLGSLSSHPSPMGRHQVQLGPSGGITVMDTGYRTCVRPEECSTESERRAAMVSRCGFAFQAAVHQMSRAVPACSFIEWTFMSLRRKNVSL